MLIRPTHTSSKESLSHKSTQSNQNQSSQHGNPHSPISILLGVPAETLTGITSYLDPPSLLSLARVHSWLHSHVKDDGTWRGAFLCQFLNIGPESERYDQVKILMLRRSEYTWRNEFIVRYKFIRRWERSRNPTVSHIPVYSQISNMRMIPGPNPALLTSSVQYGIVSRSLPLNGKILPGFLDASGSRLGQGVGNPNAEFSPDVSACALSSEGGTAKIIWGFRHGEVGVMTAPRVLDPSRRVMGDMVRCDVRDEHIGAVLDAVWDHQGRASKVLPVVATAGADGLVKLWDSQTLRCLWTSQRKPGVGPDACLKVALSVHQGVVATVDRTGDIAIWTGFQMQPDTDLIPIVSAEEQRVPCPVQLEKESNARPTVSFLHIDPHAVTPTILVAYEDHPYFYRLRKGGDGTTAIEITPFGDASFGSFISALVPFFYATESSFVLVGDTIGCVSVYDWNTPHDAFSSAAVQCVKRFEAHDDGSGVTAIAWDGLTLVTGSARGTSDVWDGLTFEHLRSFASPVPRSRGGGRNANTRDANRGPVQQIIVGPEKDVVFISVGDRVLAWKAGPISPRTGPGGVRGRHSSGSSLVGKRKKDRHGAGKYQEQVELRQTVSEAKSLLKQESDDIRRANGKAKEQRVQLENMGLNESEAVEYLLMLSRDEALQRGMAIEEGVFEVDSDSDQVGPSPSYILPSHLGTLGFDRSGSGSSTPRTTITIGEAKSQSSDSSDDVIESVKKTGSTTPIPSSVSSASSSSSSLRPNAGTPSSVRSLLATSVWNVPLQSRSSNSPPSSSVSSIRSSSSSSSSSFAGRAGIKEDNVDNELRFAIELSLAEAMSLERNV